MSDNLQLYLQQLNENTAVTMDAEQLASREEAFTHYVLSQIATKVASENYEVKHAVIKNSVGSTLGEIHAYNESANGEVLTLFYCLYDTKHPDEVQCLSDTDVQPAWNKLQGFYDHAIRNAAEDMEEDDPAYDVCRMIDSNKDNYRVVRFYIISNCDIRKSEPKKMRVRNKETDTNIWDIRKLYGNLSDTSDHVEINIAFGGDSEYQYNIPYIQMDPMGDTGYRCLLMMFPARLLFRLYKKWNTDLLLYNVRYWLSFKKTKRKHTNSDIRETLRQQPEMFLAFNNGITAIASDVELEPHGDATRVGETEEVATNCVTSGILRCIRNFQIVNGGQTTASIFKARESEAGINLRDAYVQVKLIVISKNHNVAQLASKISRSSNSQNAVKDSDFSVSEQFNTQLQEISRSVLIPNEKGELSYWFYERVRGQFEEEKSHLTKRSDVDAFNAKYPKDCRFSKEMMAIVRKSWDQEPCEAVKGAGTTYDTFIHEVMEAGKVPDETYFKNTCALLCIYNYMKVRPENKDYKNAKAPVIAYSIAYLSYISMGESPLNEIWNRQGLSEDQKRGVDKLANIMFKKLSQLADEEGSSVLSISKRKGIFQEVINKFGGDNMYAVRSLFVE